jgi:uncharacterized protein
MKRFVMLLAFAAAACSLGGGGVKETFYVLSGPEGTPNTASADAITVYVGPATVPDAVDRAPMVIHDSANQVQLPEEHRWAEPLKSAIPRVVAQYLMRELGTSRVMASRAGTSLDVDYRVALEVQRFDSSLSQGATIEVLWTITGKRANPPRAGRATVTEPANPPTPEGIAAAHSRALGRVAAQIAAAIRRG